MDKRGRRKKKEKKKNIEMKDQKIEANDYGERRSMTDRGTHGGFLLRSEKDL